MTKPQRKSRPRYEVVDISPGYWLDSTTSRHLTLDFAIGSAGAVGDIEKGEWTIFPPDGDHYVFRGTVEAVRAELTRSARTALRAALASLPD